MAACLLLTRPEADSTRFARAARAAGWQGEVLIAPLLRIALLPPPLAALEDAAALVVTSQHAVAALAAATSRRDWPIWCVGPRTAEAARHAGFAQLQEGGGDAMALRATLLRDPPPAPVLHLRGAHASMDIAAELNAAGIPASACVVYDQIAQPLGADARARLAQGGDLVLPVFSPRSARLLVEALHTDENPRARLHLLAISSAAEAAAQGMPWASIQCAQSPDARAMLAALGRVQAVLEPAEKPR